MAKWAEAGCRIIHVICTDGSKGSWDPTEDTAALVARRIEEQKNAARSLGGTGDVVFLGAVDGLLDAGSEMQWHLAQWIRRLQPEVILGHDPWKRYRLHPDHRAGRLPPYRLDRGRTGPPLLPRPAGRRGRPRPPPPRPTPPWEADEADHVEDITATFDKKLAALMCHQSQLITTMDIDDPCSESQAEAFAEKLKGRSAEHGALANFARGESFKRMVRL